MEISSPAAMYELWKQLASQHHILLLEGELGAGKTIFVKGFAEGLGLNAEQVQSPTYTYLNIYDNRLLHLDMYRLESFEQLVEKGILDQINSYDYLLIERPKWIEQLELGKIVRVQISKVGENKREVEILL